MDFHFDTLAVRAGAPAGRPCPSVGPIHIATSTIYATTEDLDAAFEGAGPFYRRNGNPTTEALEQACAALEGVDGAVAFASGMAALHGALVASGLKCGDTVLASRDLYGVTNRLLKEIFTPSGVTTTFVDTSDLEAVARAAGEVKPRVLLCESVSNPLLKVADIAALSNVARANRALLLVDNTFASPYLLRPHAFGADMVIHSTTKYLGGHGDTLGGVVTADAFTVPDLRAASTVIGGVLAPFDAALTLRGIRTLSLRMERHCANAAAVADFLAARPEVARVYYPGRPDHPQHDLAARQFGQRGFGGMVSFDLAEGSLPAASRFLDALRLALPGPTLGDVTTLAMSPVVASHRGLTPAERAGLGISDGLIRLSIGIEDVRDILADLAQALDATHHGSA